MTIFVWIVLIEGIIATILAAIFLISNIAGGKEYKRMMVERDGYKAQCDRLNKRCAELANTNINLKAELAQFSADNEEFARVIGEQQLEIERLKKSADHATIPLVESAPVPKRPRKKASTV